VMSRASISGVALPVVMVSPRRSSGLVANATSYVSKIVA
jgi:hypothetical protein